MSLNIHKRFKALVSESRKRNQMRVPAPDPPPPSIESLRTIVEAGHAPTRICAHCGETFCDEIEWKEHHTHCPDSKKPIERFACLQNGFSAPCPSEDDPKAHTQRPHEEAIRPVSRASHMNNSGLRSSQDAVPNYSLPTRCKTKPKRNAKVCNEDLQANTKLKGGHTRNDSSTPGRTMEYGLTPDEKQHSEKPTSRSSSTETTCSSQHAILQQEKLGQTEYHSELLHAPLGDHSMHNELLEPIVTDFISEMLDTAMSSFEMGFSRTFDTYTEAESDLESNGFEDYEGDTEQRPASRSVDAASRICIQPHFLDTDEKSIRTTSSNTSSELSTRISSSGSGSSSRAPSSSGEKKGKGPCRASCEDPKKRRRRVSSFNSGNDQEDGRESDEDEHVDRRKLPDSCTNGKNLACPFYQRRPQPHPKSTACIHPGFKTIARLKEHLYRQHYRISCLRCGQNFEEEEELKIHSKAKVACESTDEEPTEEYMTTQQRDQLRSKKRKVGQDTLEKKWDSIYQLLFPDDMPPLPSPYCEPTVPRPTASSSSHLADFQEFCFQRLRFLVMERFQSDLRALEPVVQARLKDSMDEILREAPAQIRRQWEEQHHTLASPGSQGSNQAGFNASKYASSNQTVIGAAIKLAQPTELGQTEQPVVGAATAECGTQGSITIPDPNGDFNDIAEYHNKPPDTWSSEGLNKLLMDHATTAAVDTNLDIEQQAQVIPQISEDPFIPLDAALQMDWNYSLFEPFNFGTHTAVMDTSASQLPGRRSDSLFEPFLQKDPDEESYSQASSCFHFEGLGTMGNVEIDALSSEVWGLDRSTAHHIADHHNPGPTSLGSAEGNQKSRNRKVEQSRISMIGLPEEHGGSSFVHPLFLHPNWDGSGSSDF